MTQRSADQGYPGLSGIHDPAVATVCRLLFDRVNSLQGRAGDTPIFRQGGRFDRQRLQEVGDPTAPQDVVTKAYGDAHYGPEAIRLALQAGGSHPIILSGLPGDEGPGASLFGTHADRLALMLGDESLPDGTIFYETDRAAIYQAQGDIWELLMCRPLRTPDTKPSDLTSNDDGFTWFDSVAGFEWRWSGGAWNYYRGSLVDTFANRPDPALADRGFLFIGSDRGEHVWRKGSSAWELLFGVGGPMFGTLSPDTKPTLTADDAGFIFASTDFDRLFRWDGAGWADASGQPMRGQIAYFSDTLLPGTGWALCDGSSVTRSTSSAGTTSFTTPNLTNRFVRAVSGATGGTGGVDSQTATVDPPVTTSGANSANQEVQSGTGTVVAGHPHNHQVDIASFSSSAFDNRPAYIEERAYVRL